jgi:adenosylcobinamide-GDP ribazoletransferase
MRDALALLTTFGRRGGELRASALRWFPLVGFALGALLGGIWWTGDHLWPRAVAAALVVLADLAFTGMLHVDGLADSADGLLPHASRERRLAIMRTPDVGAFGVAAVAVVVLLRAVTLATMTPSVLFLAGLWCTSRALVASVPAVVPYARAHGIATPLLHDAPAWPVLAAIPAAGLAAVGAGVAGIVAVPFALLAGAGIVALGWRRLGGFTGDVLGAAIVVGETAGLVVASARW